MGLARDLSPLLAAGVEQAKEVGRRLRTSGVRSPPSKVDLREWLPDSTLNQFATLGRPASLAAACAYLDLLEKTLR